jgi:hypothetical protein
MVELRQSRVGSKDIAIAQILAIQPLDNPRND